MGVLQILGKSVTAEHAEDAERKIRKSSEKTSPDVGRDPCVPPQWHPRVPPYNR
jgi:hypothetical protein